MPEIIGAKPIVIPLVFAIIPPFIPISRWYALLPAIPSVTVVPIFARSPLPDALAAIVVGDVMLLGEDDLLSEVGCGAC